ncbi:MAG: isoprenylcysteine carboxylmethyltransferase family protein [Planctomycetes bacterium]|nr:isoprenylcysteine carboxylmethyltransferase family protein [Planctomycetota bacterium]
MKPLPRRLAAIGMLVVCHGSFVLAVGSMVFALATGLQNAQGTLRGAAAVFADAGLVLQFPVLHSFLLSRRGAPTLRRLSPFGHGRTLAPSTYALVASLQLLLVFWLWSPSGVVWHQPTGWTGALQWGLFAAAWLVLQKALYDAGLALQTGAAGWLALWRNRAVDYGGMPTHGLFACVRQPIYLGFALVLLTAPVWSLDWLLLTLGWVAYCVVGPRFKEARWARLHGPRFVAYRDAVPYLLPRLRR